jgi:hypothetical protein
MNPSVRLLFLLLALALNISVPLRAEPENLPPAPEPDTQEEAPAPVEISGPEVGAVEGGVYRNAFFGLALPLPDGWTVAEPEATREMAETGRDFLAGADAAKGAALTEANQRSLPLVTASRLPLDSTGPELNASLILIAEKVEPEMNAATYLEGGRDLLMGGTLPFTPDGDIQATELARQLFAEQGFNLASAPLRLSQRYLVTIRRGFALSFVLTDESPEKIRALRELLQQMQFKD